MLIILALLLMTPVYTIQTQYLMVPEQRNRLHIRNTQDSAVKTKNRQPYVSISLSVQFQDMLIVPPNTNISSSGDIEIKNNGNVTVNISIGYIIDPIPPPGIISVNISPNRGVLPPSERMSAKFVVYVSSNATPGTKYEVRIHLTGKISRGGGNPVDISQESPPITILVGRHGYRLRLILKEPDGSSAYGNVRIYYLYGDTYRLAYRRSIMGEYVFRVIDGKYRIDVYLSGYKLVSKEIEVNSDTTIEIRFTTTLIPEDSIVVISKPTYSTDPLIFRAKVESLNPLIYRKEIAVLARVLRRGSVVVDNVVIANLTIRSKVEKAILGFIPAPENGWENGTYELQLLIRYTGGNITYGPIKRVQITVIPISIIKKTPEIPFHILLLVVGISILFGFIGAKFGIKRIGREYLPKAVGLIHGGKILTYSTWDDSFIRPEVVSGEWQKIIYGFNLLYKRYWRRAEKIYPLAITLNAEKWIFYPITRDTAYFICVHSAFNEYGIREMLARLKVYFTNKISRYGIRRILSEPAETLDDLGDKIKELFG